MKQYVHVIVIGGVIEHVAEQDTPFSDDPPIIAVDEFDQPLPQTHKRFELDEPEKARLHADEIRANMEIGGNGAPRFKDTAPRKKKVANPRNV